MKVKLEGFRELDRALSELPKATAKNVLRRVGRAALEPMANMAAAKAPEESGALAFSIAVSEKRTPRARTSTAKFVAPGVFRSDRKSSVEIAMGPAGGMGALWYATFQEFGTVNMAAQPYMRPAWDAGAQRVLDSVKGDLKAEIDKAATRLAVKRAKAA